MCAYNWRYKNPEGPEPELPLGCQRRSADQLSFLFHPHPHPPHTHSSLTPSPGHCCGCGEEGWRCGSLTNPCLPSLSLIKKSQVYLALTKGLTPHEERESGWCCVDRGNLVTNPTLTHPVPPPRPPHRRPPPPYSGLGAGVCRRQTHLFFSSNLAAWVLSTRPLSSNGTNIKNKIFLKHFWKA